MHSLFCKQWKMSSILTNYLRDPIRLAPDGIFRPSALTSESKLRWSVVPCSISFIMFVSLLYPPECKNPAFHAGPSLPDLDSNQC